MKKRTLEQLEEVESILDILANERIFIFTDNRTFKSCSLALKVEEEEKCREALEIIRQLIKDGKAATR